jgi:F-type H+-transporting ATPase subunit b
MNLITPEFGIIFWQTVTFLVVILVLGKFAWKPILQMINEREGYIKQSLDNAHEAKQLLVELKKEQTQLLENSNREREKIINEVLASKTAILETAVNEAKQISERLVADSREAMVTEKQLAFDRLKNEVLLLSVQVAEKLMVKELDTDNKQEALVRRLIKETNLN